ncbi:hypothetical protein PXH59_05035 [Xenorhabdus sp. SF857]|uniref:STY1053 family phage-associated protein n=1 Tax=Xenorhabdus bakwenae TaxID=3026967 RepID=UPI002557FB72|nr:hypothetical protein [Xenorhabdus sp. SF857]WFQ80502.1 hypothetical protein PXH59_05035 [Xenorhabdus sp. SF857]
MMKIRVHTPFRFTHDNGESETFTGGTHNVSESVAQHWFVQAHAEVIDAVENTEQVGHELLIAELRASTTDLTQQLAERDTQIAELKQQLEERDNQIARLILHGDPEPQTTNSGGKNGGNKK